MHNYIRSTALFAATIAFASCADITNVPSAPATAAQFSAMSGSPAVRISEIHYDNVGTDIGEGIEVSAPVDTDLTGWRILLYNGANGLTYGSASLTGLTVTTCDTRQVVVLPFAGLQNGDPDGMALVDAADNVVEFLSYEGTFTAMGGLAEGLTSTDVGVIEDGETPVGSSLQRLSAAATDWIASEHSFGECNDNPEPAEVDHITVSPAEAEVVVGASEQFTAVAYDVAGQEIDGVTFEWSSTAELVASVNAATGLVSGLQIGAVTIVARAPNSVTGSASVQVVESQPQPPTIEQAIALVDQLLADDKIGAGPAQALKAKLQAAQKQLEHGKVAGARGPLNALLNQLASLIHAGRLSEADGAALRTLVTGVIASIA